MEMEEVTIRRGEMHWIERTVYSEGNEIQKNRPAIVVSNNAANIHSYLSASKDMQSRNRKTIQRMCK